MEDNYEVHLKEKVLNGLFWKFLERIGIQGINFITQIVVARLLLPEDYAIIALITVFIAVANIFIQSGFNSALIQKREVDNLDYSSVFYLSLSVAVILYVVLFLCAPAIAHFYEVPLLTAVLRVQALTLFLGSINSVQQAYLNRNMMFKKSMYASMTGVAATGVVGISLAFLGCGVWALVFSQLANSIAVTITLWFVVKWRPSKLFSMERVGSLFQFSWKLVLSSLLDTLYNNARTLVIGRLFHKSLLGYYDRGDKIPMMGVSSINGAITSVMFPAFSICQHNPERLKQVLRRSIVSSCCVIFPAMIGLAAVAKPLVYILLTDKWAGSIPFMQMCSLGYAFLPIHTCNLQAINAVGRSDVFLKLEIIKKIVGVVLLVLSIPFGIYVFVGSGIVSTLICTIINAWPNKSLLNYSPEEQLKDIMPYLLLSVVMAIPVYGISFLNINMWLMLCLQVLIGTIIFVAGALFFKLEGFIYILANIRY